MKIRYDKETGLLGKAYSDNMIVPEHYLTLDTTTYDNITSKTDKIPYVIDGEIVFKDKAEEEAKKKLDTDFFPTSLGYVRRKVTMKDGAVKDFLADILPILQVGIPILTYDKDGNQSKVTVTESFIAECKQQVIKDFYGG